MFDRGSVALAAEDAVVFVKERRFFGLNNPNRWAKPRPDISFGKLSIHQKISPFFKLDLRCLFAGVAKLTRLLPAIRSDPRALGPGDSLNFLV